MEGAVLWVANFEEWMAKLVAPACYGHSAAISRNCFTEMSTPVPGTVFRLQSSKAHKGTAAPTKLSPTTIRTKYALTNIRKFDYKNFVVAEVF